MYWKLLGEVPALEILAHRVVWSLVFCLVLLTLRRDWRWIPRALSEPRQLLNLALASALLSFTWGIYIWAVNTGHVVETSLGFFINPLVSVALGVVVLRESIRPLQWLAIALAALGVIYLSLMLDRPPWIALCLAGAFGCYGLLKKRTSLSAVEGLSIETLLVLPPALAYLLWCAFSTAPAMSFAHPTRSLLLVGAGIATATPLLFFAAAARQIPLSLLGLLQYLAPSIQFFLGVAIYEEAFDLNRLIGFALIWSGLAIFAGEGLLRIRRLRSGD